LNLGEPTRTLGQTLWLLSPELVLLLAGLFVWRLDAVQTRQENRRWLPYVALAGLAAALVTTTTLWGCNRRVLSVLSCDPFALAIKTMTLVAMGIVILASDVYVRTHRQHKDLPPVGRTEGEQGTFYALLLFSALAICLLGGATDLIMIVLALDLLNVTSYVLTGHLRDDQRSTEAAIKFFLYSATLSTVMLYGLSWFYGLTGSTDLNVIAAVLRETENTLRPTILPALIFVVAGFALKIGAVPFHQWAPDTYEGAPTPVTAFLSIASMIAGLTLTLRVLLTGLPLELESLAMDWRTLLMAIATLTMTVGNLAALWQQNIKRLLAYSSVAQAGTMLVGVVAASPRGVTAALFYLIAYVLANLGAFSAVIAFSSQAGNGTGSDAIEAIEDYAGLSKQAPALALALMISLLSLGGIPPMAGFIGKLYLFSAAIEKGLLWLAVVGVINSVISLACYWKIIRAMYIGPAQTKEHLTTAPTLAVALGITMAGMLVLGIFPGPLLALLQAAAQTFFGG
jgi:NADH-quinone oxidoreductase subunit N